MIQYRLVDKGTYNLKDHYILVTIITHTNQKTYVRSEVCRQEVTQRRGRTTGKEFVFQQALGPGEYFCGLEDMLLLLKLPGIDFIYYIKI